MGTTRRPLSEKIFSIVKKIKVDLFIDVFYCQKKGFFKKKFITHILATLVCNLAV